MNRSLAASWVDCRMRFLPVVLVCHAFLSACQDKVEQQPSPLAAEALLADPGHDQGLVVAQVDGVPIFTRQVAEFLAALDGGVGLEEVASALIDQELLAREAAARGFGQDPAVASARSRTMARLLLEREIGGMTFEDIPPERLQEAYERQQMRFDRGRARVVVHALAKASAKDPGAARDLAGRMTAAVAGATDEQGFKEALAPLVAEAGKRRVVIEKLPAFVAGDTRFVAPFVEAAFAIEGPGGIGGPVETRFGWHVILVLEELPPVRIPFEEAKETIARELLAGERRKRAEALLGGLEQRNRPWIDEAAFLGGGGS